MTSKTRSLPRSVASPEREFETLLRRAARCIAPVPARPKKVTRKKKNSAAA